MRKMSARGGRMRNLTNEEFYNGEDHLNPYKMVLISIRTK